MPHFLSIFTIAMAFGLLTGCATTPSHSDIDPVQSPEVKTPDDRAPNSDDSEGSDEGQPAQNETAPSEIASKPLPDDGLLERPISELGDPEPVETDGLQLPPNMEFELSSFNALTHWDGSDPSYTLLAFQKACLIWRGREDERLLNSNLPHYGQYKDWKPICERALDIDSARDAGLDQNPAHARAFFETHFLPVSVLARNQAGEVKAGLLTGYYEPQIVVHEQANEIYSEPILGLPYLEEHQTLSRSEITGNLSPIIGYGKPIDVFFMQVQGSGRLAFPSGRIIRAAFAGHNNHPYKSIGRVLISRGEMTKDEASKQSIERWMSANGAEATRELMNNNPRYIFFKVEDILPGEGPKGSMGVPLVSMATMAVDPRHHPYGVLVWLETKLPESGRDYIGKPQGLLVSAQDTGSAIKGPIRGDLFFGSGDEAGELAGLMKHKVKFTLLLPRALALRFLLIS